MFFWNISFGHLLEFSPARFVFLKTLNSEFSYTEAWFTDQNFKPPEIEDEIKITLVINWWITYKMRYLIEPRDYG